MPYALIALYALLIAPLRVEGYFRWRRGGEPLVRIGLWCYGAGGRRRYLLGRDGQGTLALRRQPEKKEVKDGSIADAARRGGVLLRTLKRANLSRACLKNGIKVEKGFINLRLSVPDAAQTALLTGTMCASLRALKEVLPALSYAVRPDYTGNAQAEARCILELRLGILLLSALFAGAALVCEIRALKEKKDGA